MAQDAGPDPRYREDPRRGGWGRRRDNDDDDDDDWGGGGRRGPGGFLSDFFDF